MDRLKDQIAIVTGGAGAIGEAAVRLFTEEGARVVVADIDDERGEALAQELGDAVAYRHCDVRIDADVRGLMDFTLQRFGRLDLLFNNAGIPGPFAPIESVETADWDEAVAVMVRGVFLCTKHAAPLMKAQRAGSIVNNASAAGLQVGFAGHAYSVCKAAVIHMTRSVAIELGESGVRVNCVCPSAIATPVYGKAIGLPPEAARRTVPVMEKVLATAQPLRRPGMPEDVARAVLFLAGQEARFLNGHALVLDGGMAGGRQWSETLQRLGPLRAALREAAGVPGES
ncbi:MAG TPA: glucose 1-dehydrogenase [Ramlibacter sp.]|uniref:glucose 1-dehydrogenase n=1 Tax=Ramlibacter sp. TaxID=1917967 RepID=UPI002C6D2C2F|nr:glucose 1-dehydrogenase [Ramlibacter sp.]HVZ43343.1 glucose 1-dehydrogenase [Ramlibacter sp.]